MKLFFVQNDWTGNHASFMQKSLSNFVDEVQTNEPLVKCRDLCKRTGLDKIKRVKRWQHRISRKEYNAHLLERCLEAKPDLFIVFNESRIYTETLAEIKKRTKCRMACVIADDPFDSVRFTDFPHNLKYFDFIFNGEPAFTPNISRIAPKAEIFLSVLGYEPSIYKPLPLSVITQKDRERFECDLSFTGSSYSRKAEGGYRSEMLGYLTDYDLRIWGDDKWDYRFRFIPSLSKCFKGERLPYNDLLKLYTLSKINLNLANPQVIAAFQPRIFEIAAVKGFQIADNHKLIRHFFSEEEIVVFDTIAELLEKIRYYLDNEDKRTAMIDRMHKRVIEEFTYDKWAEKVINCINGKSTEEDRSLAYLLL